MSTHLTLRLDPDTTAMLERLHARYASQITEAMGGSPLTLTRSDVVRILIADAHRAIHESDVQEATAMAEGKAYPGSWSAPTRRQRAVEAGLTAEEVEYGSDS